jgi:type IV pilus assembly protein PilA
MNIKKKKGFGILELMIVLGIIGILASIAIPIVSYYREKAKLTRIASDLKTFKNAFTAYLSDNGCYPPDSHNDAPYNLINGYGTENYLPIQAWIATPPWGGFYNWEGPNNYAYAGISLFGTTASESLIINLDAILDNGDLNTGVFRKTPNGRYTYIVDEDPEDACS